MEDADEVHDYLVRTLARIAYRVRERPEADTGGFHSMKAPDNFKIELFVIRVGDWGGYMMLDCDDPLAVHKFCSMLPAFEFQARPVIPVMDAVRVELEAIAFRDGLKGK
jgi:muconolactone delta-isomerase